MGSDAILDAMQHSFLGRQRAEDGRETEVIRFFTAYPEGTEFGMYPPTAARFLSGAKCGHCEKEIGHGPANAHQGESNK
jgi:hypothetical protein